MTSPATPQPAAVSRPTPNHPIAQRMGAAARWTLAVLACLWLALCTAVGPLYWDFDNGTIAHWNWANTAIFVGSFIIYLGIVGLLVRFAATGRVLPALVAARLSAVLPRSSQAPDAHHDAVDDDDALAPRFRTIIGTIAAVLSRGLTSLGHWIVRGTNRFWKIALILFLGWLWAPTTLLAAFGADIRSQIREFSWAWNQWTGLKQPYIGFFSFVPMDIYPTAHYMWPSDPTYLTDQHNVVLTVVYGATAALSRSLTGSNDAGIVVLAAVQMLFAVFCCAATANRFLNLPWLRRLTEPGQAAAPPAADASGADSINTTSTNTASINAAAINAARCHSAPAGALARLLIIVFFLTCPLAVFATISITKSPLFAFAFVWWFGVWYELIQTWRPSKQSKQSERRNPSVHARSTVLNLSPHSLIAFVVSTSVMLISAKYAWYIIALQIVLAIIADRRRWATYVAALLIPTVLIHGGISFAISSGAIIGGDPIESRGVQLQQIARVAKRNPDGISDAAKKNLSPVFNLDQMADAYFQQDADPVKSSGIQAKKVSYKWRTVTPEDMNGFNKAWLEIVKDNPVIALDALLAKCFGYFNVTDLPYVSMDYYVTSDYVQKNSTWIKSYNHQWREKVAKFTQRWGRIPVIGWFTHGNFYVVLTLLIGAAEVIRRRWLTLMTHIPLLLLMGVMITAPANNFERHMLPVAFVFGFVALTYWRDSRRELRRSRR